MVEHCYRMASVTVNPIVDWSDNDVWEFLHYYGCRSNPLYECGRTRIGCVGCPLQGYHKMKNDFARYPGYRTAYVKAFDRMLKARSEAGLQNDTWKTGEDVMRWWLGDDPNQITIDDYLRQNAGGDET